MAVFDEQLSLEDIDDDYKKFVDKFKPKKTTDDCYTPENIYDAVLEWAASRYGFEKSAAIRPFWPGADYRKVDYPKGCVVVDNPPFSIISEIKRFYNEHGIRFFLFCPSLTALSAGDNRNCVIIADAVITYANGAKVMTAFVTNMERNTLIMSAPDFHRILSDTDKKNTKAGKKQLPKYTYPDNVCTAAMVQKYAKYGVCFKVSTQDAVFVSALDSQRAAGKGIFGGGLLLSDRAAAERAAAERAAAERAPAERWQLSPREREIIKMLGGRNGQDGAGGKA